MNADSLMVQALARANESEPGEAERRMNEAEIEEAEQDLRERPHVVVEGDIKRDWRYRMGFIAGLRRRDARIAWARETLGRG